MQQIEAQNSILLSRTLGTPNISSKGVLEQRAVSIPSALFPPGYHHHASLDKSPDRNLIEEVTAPKVDDLSSHDHVRPRDSVTPHSNSALETPSWTWGQEDGKIRITIRVPKLVGALLFRSYTLPDVHQTHATISSATLDLEPRRFTLLIPDLYALDIDLELPDEPLGKARSGVDPQGTEYIATLKQTGHLDVDQARAEWRIKERSLVIVA